MAGGGEVPRGHDGDDQLARFQRLHQLFAVLADFVNGEAVVLAAVGDQAVVAPVALTAVAVSDRPLATS